MAAAIVLVVSIFAFGQATPPPCFGPPVDAEISDPFRPPGCTWCPGNRGQEYATVAGDVARSVATGTVSFAGLVAGTRYVVVDIGHGYRVTYGGLASTALSPGDVVVVGSRIGVVRGRLHFGVRKGSVYLDPARFIGEPTGRIRLVPLHGPTRASTAPGWSCTAPETVRHRARSMR